MQWLGIIRKLFTSTFVLCTFVQVTADITLLVEARDQGQPPLTSLDRVTVDITVETVNRYNPSFSSLDGYVPATLQTKLSVHIT